MSVLYANLAFAKMLMPMHRLYDLLQEQDISGVGVTGQIQGTATSFKETSGTGRLLPTNSQSVLSRSKLAKSPQNPFRGSASTATCVRASVRRARTPVTIARYERRQKSLEYCLIQVAGGGEERCGPRPSTTPLNTPCADDCR